MLSQSSFYHSLASLSRTREGVWRPRSSHLIKPQSVSDFQFPNSHSPAAANVRHVPPLPSALVQAYLRYCATLRYVTGTSRRPSIESPAVKHAFPTDFRGAIAVFNDQEAFTAANNGKAAAAKGGTPGGGPCGDLARMCRCCIGLPQI